MQRWVAAATADPPHVPGTRAHFTITDDLRVRLAYHRGNAAALRRELLAQARVEQDAAPVPSLPTLHRAIRRDISPADRAGYRRGERARRAQDVYLARPPTYRNQAWETDHVEAAVIVDIDGCLRRPWLTLFVDCATCAIVGVAATPGYPSRESLLCALRAALLREEPYGPFGGLPATVRMDRGKDFLSRAVREALGAFAVTVHDLPAYRPHLKGTVESVNRAVDQMFLAHLPHYLHAQTLGNAHRADPEQPARSWQEFLTALFAWVHEWNFEHPIERPGDLATPYERWCRDSTPIQDVPAEAVASFTLEDSGTTRKITTKGVRWANGHYADDWMGDCKGRTVRVRYMPHHDHEIEVYDAKSGRHLGRGFLSNQAGPQLQERVLRAHHVRERRLAAELRAAEKMRRERYAAANQPAPPQRLGALTEDRLRAGPGGNRGSRAAPAPA